MSSLFLGDSSTGDHLFPFRTESLSPVAPMVLPIGGRVGRCRDSFLEKPMFRLMHGLFSFYRFSPLPFRDYIYRCRSLLRTILN